ncbi:MAG: hypothetical protein UX04_C0003G0025 [Microgenomates group bacterium GW2011_GWF2_45_18]|nr:MAG: hypothetical protein UW18_C0002G0025 [Microgenomates group bacterium GW2011_GWF1_44_10]KKU01753.1 MAG: hypothetical protein UX04_C0003G0025 [Microgenomates group bacterium GW2011_GWF2_45_18]OGJ41576.1 MAG: hypothetical protein A2378_03030 [Candidatus Pacebacteria bacterium RIFOXYB1_FULL_44_10]HAU98944.1 YibE/F family protein [Candidatus Paceibacterota bacterium]HAX01099.1 YibE/F family protein [Candidatus Paceibacterota bacterium]
MSQQSYRATIESLDSNGAIRVRIIDEAGAVRFVLAENAIDDKQTSRFELGQTYIVTKQPSDQGDRFLITDVYRVPALGWLGLAFFLCTLIIGRFRGLFSLIGMAVSFLIIWFFLLPMLLKGVEPLFITVATSVIIVPVTFFLSHGFGKKTNVALIATVISLFFSGLLAMLAVELSRLTGLSSEEAGFLLVENGDRINFQGLLLAGIMIGMLGVLDDITISQSAIVFELKEAKPTMTPKQLFHHAMEVGRDHIASMVNTLVLAYTGVALPLVMLFVNSGQPWWFMLNSELIAEEVVRTLVGSIGLITAVPLTTLIAARVAGKSKK